MTRTAIYIDGGPFTDGIRGQGMSMDMDLAGLVRDLAGQTDVVSIHFVAPEYPAFPYPAKNRNEQRRLQAFAAQGISIHLCKPQIIGSVFIDRGVEADLATRLIIDAVDDVYDVVLIVSRRAELGPAIDAVKRIGKRTKVAFFAFRLDPINPLDAIADERAVIEVEEVVARRNSGPRPPRREQ